MAVLPQAPHTSTERQVPGARARCAEGEAEPGEGGGELGEGSTSEAPGQGLHGAQDLQPTQVLGAGFQPYHLAAPHHALPATQRPVFPSKSRSTVPAPPKSHPGRSVGSPRPACQVPLLLCGTLRSQACFFLCPLCPPSNWSAHSERVQRWLGLISLPSDPAPAVPSWSGPFSPPRWAHRVAP